MKRRTIVNFFKFQIIITCLFLNYLFGLALYFEVGVKEDKESGISYLEEVVVHGNFELLMDMFFYLLKTDDNRIKVLIVDGLNKAGDEIVKMGMD